MSQQMFTQPTETDWQWARERRTYFKQQGRVVVRSVLGIVITGWALTGYRHDEHWIAQALIVSAVVVAVALVLLYGETFSLWIMARRIRAEELVEELRKQIGTLETKLDVSQRSHAGVMGQLEESDNLLNRSIASQALADQLMARYWEGAELTSNPPLLETAIEGWKEREKVWLDNVEATIRTLGGNAIDVRYVRYPRSYTHIPGVKAHPDALYGIYEHMARMTHLNQLVDKYGVRK